MIEPRMDTDKHGYGRTDDDLTFRINGCAMSVLNAIGHGFHEKIYENALGIEFDHAGLKFSRQRSFDISYKDKNIGTFVPDFVVEDCVIVELKTVDRIGDNEKGQVLNYLRASGLKLGIIMNFKSSRLEWQRVVL